MQRPQLEHIIRAAAPVELLVSIEADLFNEPAP
jgi:hypothetical protein